jgi:AcrR family transcriptional regulator
MMSVIGSDSRQRMIQSAALLFREQGYSGTGFRDVIEHSGAPRGSIYHHFPGGKEQLAEETMTWAGGVIARQIERAARDGDPIATLRGFVGAWREVLESSEFRAGCPVVAVAVEADAGAGLAAAGQAFTRWEDLIAGTLRSSGVARAEARRLATLCVAAIEGAIVLCRAEGDIRPLRDVGRELEGVLSSAVPARRARPPGRPGRAARASAGASSSRRAG